jgi:hypothetical protein
MAERGANQGIGDREPVTLISTVFPTRANAVFITAVVLGVLFVTAPFLGRVWLPIEDYRGNLVLCLGVALILAAFGSQATLRTGSLILVGTAAIAVGLYGFLEHERKSHEAELIKTYVKGILSGIDSRQYAVRIKFQQDILGAHELNDPQYDFVVFRDDIITTVGTIEVTKKPGGEPIQIVIPKNCFAAGLGTGQLLEWEYHTGDQSVWDRKNHVNIGKFGDPQRAPSECPQLMSDADYPVRSLRGLGLIRLMPRAFAQSTKGSPPALLIDELKSDDLDTRRTARDQIAALPVESLRPVLDSFAAQYKDYRVKLGICVALAEMLRMDKGKGASIRGLLTDADRDQLLDAAGDPDRTVRIYATEFLFDLGDLKTATLAIQRAATTDNDTARYQWLFQAQSGWLKLSKEQREQLQPLLDQIKSRTSGKTLTLLGKFVS